VTPADVARAVLELYAGDPRRFVFGAEPARHGDVAWSVRGAAELLCPSVDDRGAFLAAFLIAWIKLTGWHYTDHEATLLSFSEVERALQDVVGIERPPPVMVE
jgi:hypothetical protein